MRPLLLTLLLAACSGAPTSSKQAPAPGPIAATMNDVSILYPLPSTSADRDRMLAPSDRGALGVLLPSQLYASIGQIGGSTSCGDDSSMPACKGSRDGAEQLAEYDDLRVVSLSLDPCFASLAPDPHGAGCTAQLRLVFQEVIDGVAADSGLHAFYALDRDDLLVLAADLVDLRAELGGPSSGPLAPNPLLRRDGLGGPFAEALRSLVLRFAGEKNLTRVARLQIFDSAAFGIWTMDAADVQSASSGKQAPLSIPTLDGATQVTVEETTMSGLQVSPETTAPDDYLALLDGNVAPGMDAAFSSLLHVDDPTKSSFDTIDCASCHLVATTEQNVVRPLLGLDDRLDPAAFVPDERFVARNDTAPTLPIVGDSMGELDLHAFSYLGTSPSINQRVANETALVVAYLNQLP